MQAMPQVPQVKPQVQQMILRVKLKRIHKIQQPQVLHQQQVVQLV